MLHLIILPVSYVPHKIVKQLMDMYEDDPSAYIIVYWSIL